MKAERNNFNVMLGDTIYSDSEVPGPAPADRAEREAEVGQVQDQPGQQEPPGAAPLGRLLLALGRPRVRERLLARRELVRQRRERERPHALQPRREGVPRLRAGELEQAERPLPHRSLGPQPRGVLPRPALFPERERGREPRLRQPADGQPGRGADRAADHAQPVRAGDAVAGAAGVPGLPRHDPQPEPHLPGQAAADSAS